MEIEISGVDAKRGLDLFEGDVETYVDILRSYVTNIPDSLDKIRNVSEETLRDYAIRVHGVKGASETIGADEAKKTAKQLEEMAKGGNIAGVLARNNAFIKYAENLIDAIKIWLGKYDAAGGVPQR